MRTIKSAAVTISVVAAVFTAGARTSQSGPLPEPGERHFGRIRQLTFGGENAEAYFSHDGKRLIFQAVRGAHPCDQQFVMNVDGSNVHHVSTGFGKTTCGYFFDGDRKIFFGSTHAADTACPPKPDP